MSRSVELWTILQGSDAEKTRQLYAELQQLGAAGELATNLFRACKTSARAKVYRRRSHTAESYGRKEWSLGNACEVLARGELDFTWGWKVDPKQPVHRWVLYIDLPTGQISFHTGARFAGPDYAGEWDGVRESQADRIVSWTGQLLQVDRVAA